MAPVFITPLSEPLNRWVIAFPSLVLVPSVEKCMALSPETERICFLDLQGFTGDDLSGGISRLDQGGWRVIAMSGTQNDLSALTYISQGARGYCSVVATPEHLLAAASAVSAGRLWVPTTIVNRFAGISSKVTTETTPPELSLLTDREHQVALLVGQGLSNREIAEELKVSERTVKAHLTVCFEKLDLRDRVQLALLANGLKVR